MKQQNMNAKNESGLAISAPSDAAGAKWHGAVLIPVSAVCVRKLGHHLLMRVCV